MVWIDSKKKVQDPKGLFVLVCVALYLFCLPSNADTNMCLSDVPAYGWEYGCFGTASGVLMGYWDREGFPDIYTGTISNGVAPLTSNGNDIYCLWASRKDHDGNTNWGHVDDYYVAYESTNADPWIAARGVEHSPDCIGDFMGLSQLKWTNMNGECDGNIDAFVFNYFDTSGAKRVNFTPDGMAGPPARDLQSGLRAFAEYRGCNAEVFSQLADVWYETPEGTGFTYEDLKAEIDAGYPVLLFLQEHKYANGNGQNPELHGVVAVGYYTDGTTEKIRTRWGWSASTNAWVDAEWTSNHLYGTENWSYLRGVIGFHPRPMLRTVSRTGDVFTITWDGPTSKIHNNLTDTTSTLHWYRVEAAASLIDSAFTPVTTSTTERIVTFTNTGNGFHFFRIQHQTHP